jgi:hypothetical protein
MNYFFRGLIVGILTLWKILIRTPPLSAGFLQQKIEGDTEMKNYQVRWASGRYSKRKDIFGPVRGATKYAFL